MKNSEMLYPFEFIYIYIQNSKCVKTLQMIILLTSLRLKIFFNINFYAEKKESSNVQIFAKFKNLNFFSHLILYFEFLDF